MHNEKCKFNNKSVNSWLSEEDQVEEFIIELIKIGWIKLNEDPEHSRFWKLINEEDGKMFGVFSAAEKTFIYDWIAGANLSRRMNPVNSEYIKNFIELNDFSYLSEKELSLLQQKIQISTNTGHKLSKLMPYLAPHQHHQEIGLWATQKVVEYIFPFLGSNFK